MLAFLSLGAIVSLRSIRLLTCVLAFAASVSAALPARADLKFIPQQLPDGTRYILISGQFEPRDDLLLLSNLITSYKPQFISFNSPGGNVVKALMLGRLIRIFGIPTFQTRPYQCDSACAFAFVGGTVRIATAGSIGVHQNSISKGIEADSHVVGEALQGLTGDILGYLREMGVSSELLELALKTPPDDMRHLTSREMLRMRVVTTGKDEPQASEVPKSPPPAFTEQRRESSITSQNLHECDRLAANAYDARKHHAAKGVDYSTLLSQRKEATTQCEQAVSQFPNELRFQYQLARSIELDNPKRAAAIYSNLINARYLAAYDNLGWMYNTGRYGGKVDRALATKLFREGAELGDPDSMHSLGVSLWEDKNLKEAADWFRRAVKLGHLEAKNNFEKLEAEMKHSEQQHEVFPLFRFFKQK
jgi:hypothetical protein